MSVNTPITAPAASTSRAWRRPFWPVACGVSCALHGALWAWCGTLPWGPAGARAEFAPDEVVFELRLRVSDGDGDGESGTTPNAPVLVASAAAEPQVPVVEDAPASEEPATSPANDELGPLAPITPFEWLAVAEPSALELAARDPLPNQAPAPLVLPPSTQLATVPDAVASNAAAPLPPAATASAEEAHVEPARSTGAEKIAGSDAPGSEISRAKAIAAPAGPASSSSSATSVASASRGVAETPTGGETKGVVLLDGPRPIYPPDSELYGEKGEVVCLLHIDVEGKVTLVELLSTSGYKRLDRSALDGLKRWRFQPALENGRPVACKLRHKVSFVFQ